MVNQQIIPHGVNNQTVLEAMRAVPRHRFVPEPEKDWAYADRPVPIGLGQTISQPYMVAYMTEQLELSGTEKVLEIGTGCGYQTAILGLLAREVVSVEIIQELARPTAKRLAGFGYENLRLLLGDGSGGYDPDAPYDRIIVTAASDHPVDKLRSQLKPGGRMLVPMGQIHDTQQLMQIDRMADGGFREQELMLVRFVPLTGTH